jgi:hypothetical protein
MGNLRILVGEKVSIETIAIGCTETKTVRTVFLEVIKDIVAKNQKNIFTVTSTNFPSLLENIVKDSDNIIKLQLPENIQIYNGWRNSQSGKNGKKIARVEPFSKENFEEIKILLSNYLITEQVLS